MHPTVESILSNAGSEALCESILIRGSVWLSAAVEDMRPLVRSLALPGEIAVTEARSKVEPPVEARRIEPDRVRDTGAAVSRAV
jgi:hypothetical protein